jgi:hypothetical protein
VGALIENQLTAPALVWRLRKWFGVVSTLRPGIYSRSGISNPWDFLSPAEDGLVEGDWLPGCAMMWRTTPARELRFNGRFEGYSNGEDLDFSLRMRAEGALAVAGRARVLHHQDERGRPDAYAMGYASLRNWHDIHRRCLPNWTPVDGVYFVYGICFDTLIHGLAMLKGRNLPMRWHFLRGRLRSLIDLFLGKHRVEPLQESK